MSDETAREGLLDKVYESIAQGKLSPTQALDFFSKMNLDKKETEAILVSLHEGEITAIEAKEEISFLVMNKGKGQHKHPA